MRLYAVSVAAQRNAEIGVQTMIAVLPDDATMDNGIAELAFAPTEGWENHYFNALELTQQSPLDSYRLLWSLEPAE